MGLSTSAPSDAAAPAEHAIAERLQLILRLAEAGVLVLVDGARQEQLGRFVRTLLLLEPKLEVLTSALGLSRVEPGSAVVLVPDVAEAAWMNQERPLLASRRLRVILFSDKASSAEIARKAPGFFHWTSHWMEAPTGAWPPAMLGLRAAEKRNEPVVWIGGDWATCFADAFFASTEYLSISASKPYEELLEILKKEERWIAVSDVDGPFRLRRVKWAMGESGRRGKLILIEPPSEAPGFLRVDGRMMAPKAAEKLLAEAGATHPARIAAILDCEAEVVEVAAQLLRKGVAEAEVFGVWQNEDPAAGILELAERYAVVLPDNGAFVGRLKGVLGTEFAIGNLLDVARAATDGGDAEVGEHFARRALLGGENRADSLLVLVDALVGRNRTDEVLGTLREVMQLSTGEDLESKVRHMFASAMLTMAEISRGELRDARRTIDSALHKLKTLSDDEQTKWRPMLLSGLAEVLLAQSDLEGAKRTADKVAREFLHSSTRFVARALKVLAQIALDNGDMLTAKKHMETELEINERLLGEEHPLVGDSLLWLGSIALREGNLAAAEPLLRRAVVIFRRAGHRTLSAALVELGTLLRERAELDEAETVLEEACRIAQSPEQYANALHQLAGVLVAKGQLNQAHDKLEEALVQGAKARPSWRIARDLAAIQTTYAYVLLELGDYERGLELARKVHRTSLREFGPNHNLTKSAADLLARIVPSDSTSSA